MTSIYLENINFYRNLLSASSSDLDSKQDASASLVVVGDGADTTICARIRPLAEEEEQSQHVSGILASGTSNAILFEPRQKFNGAPDAHKHEFALDHVYDAGTLTEILYQDVAQELVPWIWAGGISTLFAYGQTGSGKTFTVTGITKMVVKDLMSMLLGKRAYDLFDNRRVFSIMEDSFGTMQLVGVQEKCPSSESEFLDLIHAGAMLRTSAPTTKNDQSSRSHAMYRIRAVNKSHSDKADGELFLVDLAGSEGSQDSKNHSRERLAETRDINTSLSTLKDRTRGRTPPGPQLMHSAATSKKDIHIPWRSSKLTQVLKHVFDTQGERACKTVVIACVAPSIVDSSHSKNTLRYAEMLKVPVPKLRKADGTTDPSGWSNEKVKQWITANSGVPAIDASILAEDLTGKQVCKLLQKEFVSRCLRTSGVEEEQARAFYQKFWRTRIDSRQRASAINASESVEHILEPQADIAKTPFQERIQPGMFVRLVPGASKLGGAEIFMIMSPSRREDFDGVEEQRQFVCAVVAPSIMTDAYELHVASRHTCTVKDMAAEVLMEYDSATRYYYMDL